MVFKGTRGQVTARNILGNDLDEGRSIEPRYVLTTLVGHHMEARNERTLVLGPNQAERRGSTLSTRLYVGTVLHHVTSNEEQD